jgi:hypothetical protein
MCKSKNPKWVTKGRGTRYVLEPSLVTRSVSKKEREWKPKRAISIEEP